MRLHALGLVAAAGAAILSSGCLTYTTEQATFNQGLTLGVKTLAGYRDSIYEKGDLDHYGFSASKYRISRFAHSSSGTFLRIELLRPERGALYTLPSPEARAHFMAWEGWYAFEERCRGSVEVLELSPDSITLAIDLVIEAPDGEEQPFKKDIAFTKSAKMK